MPDIAVQFTENIHLRVANRAGIGYNKATKREEQIRAGLEKEVYPYV